jgi:DNA-directed RNA polymerase specialized sigma24 family protein
MPIVHSLTERVLTAILDAKHVDNLKGLDSGALPMSTSGRRRERGLMFAACAVALATAVGTPYQAAASETRAIQQIERYCTASWRNAGIRRQDWEDCTQQALVELLASLTPTDLSIAIEQPDSEARRELNRAVWRLVKRCRRQVTEVTFVDAYATSQPVSDPHEDWRRIESTAEVCLSARQKQILDLTRDGWRVSDIAVELGSSSERISDEKYKAIAKLRERLADEKEEESARA